MAFAASKRVFEQRSSMHIYPPPHAHAFHALARSRKQAATRQVLSTVVPIGGGGPKGQSAARGRGQGRGRGRGVSALVNAAGRTLGGLQGREDTPSPAEAAAAAAAETAKLFASKLNQVRFCRCMGHVSSVICCYLHRE